MKRNAIKKRSVCFMLCLLISVAALCQSRRYTVSNAHSHNDYVNTVPFYTAYRAGFGSIEADIYLFNNRLLVGHDSADLVSNRSIEAYYLMPLDSCIRAHRGSVYADPSKQLILLIDIKNAPAPALDSLIRLLKRYPRITACSSLKITITGSRPDPETFTQYPDFIWFDGVLSIPYSEKALSRIVLLSDNLRSYVNWRGTDTLPAAGAVILRTAIGKGHGLRKPVRFWNAPDTPYAWEQLMGLDADYLNTDHIGQISLFLAGRP